MSDVFAKRRPMIDLDEFERRLSRSCSTDQKDGDPLAELLRIIGDKDAPLMTDLEPEPRLSAKVRLAGETAEGKQPDAQVREAAGDFAAIEAGSLDSAQPRAAKFREAESSTAEHKGSNARVPLISGDFAAIEAGLLGTPREQATAIGPEPGIANAFPSVDLGLERRLYRDDPHASGRVGVPDRPIRSRRPLYVMMATIIVGMAGIAVSVGLNSRHSDSSGIAPVEGDNLPDKQQTGTTSGADAPARDTDILSNPPEAPPAAVENGTKQPLDSAQGEQGTPAAVAPVESAAPIEKESTAVPSAPSQAQPPAEPLSMAAPVEPGKVEANPTRPDVTPVPSREPPKADVTAAPPPAAQSAASAKAPAGKTGGRVAKPLKPASARHASSHGRPHRITHKAELPPASPPATEPAPAAAPMVETPAAQPNPAPNGAFGVVQNAVNSLTSTASKFMEGISGPRP